jgi:Xaa-Pro aminopeptidase
MSDPDYERRLSEIRDGMADRGLSSVLVWGEPHGTHGVLSATNDIGYVTNWPLRHPGMGVALLVVPLKDDPVMLVTGPEGGTARARSLSHFDDIRHVNPEQLAATADTVLSGHDDSDGDVGVVRLDDIPFWLYEDLSTEFSAESLVDAAAVFEQFRVVKSDAQISRLETAAETADAMFETLAERIGVGVERAAVTAEMEHTAKLAGAEFATTWLSSGPRGGTEQWMEPRQTPGTFQEGELFAAGVQVVHDDYWGHSIRMGTLGDPTPEQRGIFEVVTEAQQVIVKNAAPGVELSELYAAVQSVYESHGYGNGFRSLHGLGLRYGGPPKFPRQGSDFDRSALSMELEAGMVFEAHPNIWAGPSGDVTGALGDMVVVTEDGSEYMTTFPRELSVYQ